MQIYGFFGIRMQDCARYGIYTSEKLNTNRHKAITNMNKFKYLTFAIPDFITQKTADVVLF